MTVFIKFLRMDFQTNGENNQTYDYVCETFVRLNCPRQIRYFELIE